MNQTISGFNASAGYWRYNGTSIDDKVMLNKINKLTQDHESML